MNKPVVTPWVKVRDVSLIILLWVTISPLMSVPNRYYTYLSRKQLIWLTVFSPFVWTIVVGIFIVFGMPTIFEHFPSLADSVLAFAKPEIDSVVSSSDEYAGQAQLLAFVCQSFLVAYFSPVYLVCVGVLFLAMAVTGWSYKEASVYICQLGEPIVCCIVALVLIVLMLKKVMRCRNIAHWFMVIPILVEGWLGVWCVGRFLKNFVEFKTMSIGQYFYQEVVELLELGRETGTNYVVANMIVYIFPLLVVLFVGYVGWVIWTLTWRSQE